MTEKTFSWDHPDILIAPFNIPAGGEHQIVGYAFCIPEVLCHMTLDLFTVKASYTTLMKTKIWQQTVAMAKNSAGSVRAVRMNTYRSW